MWIYHLVWENKRHGAGKGHGAGKKAWRRKKRAWRWEKGAWRGAMLKGAGGNTNPITLGGRRGTTDEFATIPFHLDLFSAALVELAKSIPVHSLILSSHLFFCLPLFLFPVTVPCRIVFAEPEDLETWPNHLSFCFLTRVRSSSYSPMAAWIFLRTSSLVTWSFYEMFNSLR